MATFAQDLKNKLGNLVESVKSWRTPRGNESEDDLESQIEQGGVQDRGIKLSRPGGPTRPSVPKGPPGQTH